MRRQGESVGSPTLWLLAVLAVGLGIAGGAAEGQVVFLDEATPVYPVPPERYGAELRPVAVIDDTTWFDQALIEPSTQRFFMNLDISGDYLFVATGRGLAIYNIADQANPFLEGFLYGPAAFPFWGHSDKNHFIYAVDAYDNGNRVVLGASDQGVVVVNTTNKKVPVVTYQDWGCYSYQMVSVLEEGGQRYLLAADSFEIRVYDLDAAEAANGCLERPLADGVQCPGVYLGNLFPRGDASNYRSLSGIFDGYLVSRQRNNPSIMDIHDVSNPLNPILRLSHTFAGTYLMKGVLWRHEGQLMAGLLIGEAPTRFEVYNVSCLEGTGACSLGSPLSVSIVPNNGTDNQQYPHSDMMSVIKVSPDSGGTAHAYISHTLSTGVGTCSQQREYLFDLSNPASPRELTPTLDPAQYPEGYWGWYYTACYQGHSGGPGFNFVQTNGALLKGDILYRAMGSFLDSHRTGIVYETPVPGFTWTQAPAPGPYTVVFRDQSTNAPTAWQWDFDNDGEIDSVKQNPIFTFKTTGPHNVVLIASNPGGVKAVRMTIQLAE